MRVIEIYSRRKKRAEQTEPDVYQYDELPDTLRVQIEHILNDAIGPYDEYNERRGLPHNNSAWRFIRNTLCREKGKVFLVRDTDPKSDCLAYLKHTENVDDALDLVELSFVYISRVMGDFDEYKRRGVGATLSAKDTIDELNFRIREAGVGYQFENDKIVRVDSALIHAEVVRPALHLLSDPRFAGPQEEFMAAHAHYRAGEYKDCVTDTLNAFESTMKAICDIKGWEYKKGARASDLVKVLRGNGLLPDYLDNSFDQLIATLSSGLPKVRNEAGGHGQGAEPRETPGYVAAYALHLAGAKIVLLVDALKESAGGTLRR